MRFLTVFDENTIIFRRTSDVIHVVIFSTQAEVEVTLQLI